MDGYDWESECYVYIDFVKSGRLLYTVNDKENNFYLHKTIIRNREEEVVPFDKLHTKHLINEEIDCVF